MKNKALLCQVFQIVVLFVAVLSSKLLASKNIVLIAAPGSGKGTFSQYMVQEHGYAQICPGDIFRSEIERQTELGLKIKPIVESGEYVDEDITCNLILTHLAKALEEHKHFIIDGFPRTEYAFNKLHNFLTIHHLVSEIRFVQFVASDDVCLNRILYRQVCVGCAHVYNTATMKPQVDGVCDGCGMLLKTRSADTEEITKKRLIYFHKHIEPLLKVAQNSYEVRFLNTDNSFEKLTEAYENLIG